MAKQNVFNFNTMQFELVECDDLLSLIDNLNAECVAQQGLHLTGGSLPAQQALSKPEVLFTQQAESTPAPTLVM